MEKAEDICTTKTPCELSNRVETTTDNNDVSVKCLQRKAETVGKYHRTGWKSAAVFRKNLRMDQTEKSAELQ